MDINFPVITGTIATGLFALSILPMVVKAYRTKDLKSYSLGYLLLGNAGNIFYSIYVYDLPPGPIWLLHTFYLIITGLMLFCYLRYELWGDSQGKNPHFQPLQPALIPSSHTLPRLNTARSNTPIGGMTFAASSHRL